MNANNKISSIILVFGLIMGLFTGSPTLSATQSTAVIEVQIGHQKVATAGLPGGVTSRINKINTELDKVEKALAQGVGNKEDRAKRASTYLKAAKRYRVEIDKRYSGKFSPDQAEIKAVDERMAQVEAQIAKGGEATASPQAQAPQKAKTATTGGKLPAAVANRLKKLHQDLDRAEGSLAKGYADQARYKLESAKNYLQEIYDKYADAAPDDHSDMQKAKKRVAEVVGKIQAAEGKNASEKAKKDQDQAAKQKMGDISKKWADIFRPFVEGSPEHALNVYGTEDAEVWNRNKQKYDEIKPAWDEYQKTNISQKSLELQSLEQQLARQIQRFEELYPQWEKKQKDKAAALGVIVFAAKPINPESPKGLTKTFKAGDNIYCLIQTKMTWKEIYKNDVNVRIDTLIDDKKIHAQFIKINSPKAQDQKTLLFEIAPAPNKMTAYSNPDFEYGTSKANLRQGPQEMAQNLAELGPGKHTVKFQIQHFNIIYAAGEFTIEGKDYKYYAGLLKKYQQAAADAVVLPKAKMKNAGLEKEMSGLLETAGWQDIHRLNIVDKDWWINRVSGGNSPVKSRHIDAAVLSKDKQGYFYKKVRFEQPMLITGDWGKLRIAHTWSRYEIPKENINK